MSNKIVLDTSALMENNNIIERLLNFYDIIINTVSLEELENNKISANNQVVYKARQAIRQIDKFMSHIKFDDSAFIHSSLSTINKNDSIIVSCAYNHGAKLYTHDVGMKVKAGILNVPCISIDEQSSMYRGYIEYCFNTNEYNEYWENRSEYIKGYYINQYIIINFIDTNETIEYRYDGNDLVRLKLPDSRIIKAQNSLQRCALDILNNKDIEVCAILGLVGSGKTYLSLRMALNALKKDQQTKIVGIREPVGEGERIGYLKGDFDDKTYKFFAPLIQCLEGGEQELMNMTDYGQFESTIPYFLKGMTYKDTIMIADEAEDLSEKQIRLIGTRLGENSRIFFAGDYAQSVFNSTINNPLAKMCEEFKGNPRFACIYLGEDVRSEASKMFAYLFQNKE